MFYRSRPNSMYFKLGGFVFIFLCRGKKMKQTQGLNSI
nr:MAG TPA: hypothetical protein [Caudoviricetes sp.]